MATIKIKVDATVSALEHINIPLIRADQAEVTNIFRIFFELSLAFLSAAIGHVLSIEKMEGIHWFALGIPAFFTAVSLIITIVSYRKSRKF